MKSLWLGSSAREERGGEKVWEPPTSLPPPQLSPLLTSHLCGLGKPPCAASLIYRVEFLLPGDYMVVKFSPCLSPSLCPSPFRLDLPESTLFSLPTHLKEVAMKILILLLPSLR